MPHNGAMSRAFFEQVVEALVGFLPPERRGFSWRVSGRNAKLWFGDEAREHYEVQLVRQGGATVLEVGFHAEHSDAARNEAAIDRILAAEADWRPALGDEVRVGRFLDHAGPWRRASETWDDGDLDLSDPGVAIDAADRLSGYITAFEAARDV